MLAFEANDLLRLAIFSGLLGFAAFCISYSVLVWRRRNSGTASRLTWIRGLSYVSLLLGCIGIFYAWAASELQRRDGIASGSELFVVHARRDSVVQNLATGEEVAPGEAVAEFLPPANEARLAVLERQEAAARARLRVAQVNPVPVDPLLLQHYAHLRQQLTQAEGMRFELEESRREVEKDRVALLTSWTREKSQIAADLASADAAYAAAASQLQLAESAFRRTSALHKTKTITQPQFEEARAALLSASHEREKQRILVSSLKGRLEVLEKRFDSADATLSQQLAAIDADLVTVRGSIKAYSARLSEAERLLAADRQRARQAVAREVEAAEIEVTIAAAERKRAAEATQVRAPFDGRVVYRHPAPGLAPEGAPVLAISPGLGFLARIRLPAAEAEELAATPGSVRLALEHPLLQNYVTGRFLRSEPLPLEEGHVVALRERSAVRGHSRARKLPRTGARSPPLATLAPRKTGIHGSSAVFHRWCSGLFRGARARRSWRCDGGSRYGGGACERSRPGAARHK